MKFFEDHFNKHHLFHKPHRWFLAFLVSPIHAAEMHYKKKYHLTFRHAKKLFFFDMLLLLFTGLLFLSTVLWFTYDPTVTDLVSLSIRSSEDRIESGSYVTYTFAYTNYSDVTIEEVELALLLPAGFEIDTSSAGYNNDTQTFSLTDLSPGSNGATTISGWFYDVPDEENRFRALLSYSQLGETREELIARETLTTLRGSVLASTLTAPQTILGSGSFPVRFTLTNSGDRPLSEIEVPLQKNVGITLSNIQADGGVSTPNLWQIETLAAGESITLTALANTSFGPRTKAIDFVLTPSVVVNNTRLNQSNAIQEMTILHPSLLVESGWPEAVREIGAGESAPLSLTVSNTGDTVAENIVVSLSPDSRAVDLSKLRTDNAGIYQNGTLRIGRVQEAKLARLSPGEQVTTVVQIPVRYAPTASVLEIPVSTQSDIAGITGKANSETLSSPLPIGTQLLLGANARYYTEEGDQLGRGPLPPTVGKETKYWGLFTLTNTNAEASDATFRATLAPGVTWTNRASVSLGPEPQYNENTRTVTWSYRAIPAGVTVGINMELSITPTEADRGQVPVLVKNISASVVDSVTGKTLTRYANAIDASLPQDQLGAGRGIRVR